MFTECRDTLKECLIQIGAAKNIHTSQKLLKASNESRIFAVLFENDGLEKSRNKRIYTDAEGKHKRRKKFNRSLTFSVVIGEYTIEKVQELYDKFIETIPEGIYVHGNYVEIEPVTADWTDNEDTIIRAKCAVEIKVICRGGVYKDTDFAKADNVEITADRKELQDGKERSRKPERIF